MLKRILAFVICFCLSLCLFVLLKDWKNNQISQNVQDPCNYDQSKTTFSKRHYFTSKQIEGLLGKKVRNLKCGKIKCAVGLGNCKSVEIGEMGTIKSLQPRFGFDDFLLVIEWERGENWRAALAEQNPDKLFSYVGNDYSFEFIK
jgi:hypothetical protein